MTTLWASLLGLFTVVIGLVGGILGHKLGTKDKDQEVELAKDSTAKATEARVREEISIQSKAEGDKATANAKSVAAQAQAGVAQKTGDQVDESLKSEGWMRD